MIKLFLRNYILFVLIILGLVGAVYFFSLSLTQHLESRDANVLFKNVFVFYGKKLEAMPQAKWPGYLQKISPDADNPLSLVSLADLPATVDRNALLKGNVVIDNHRPDGYTPAYAFYHLPNTGLALKMGVFQSDITQYVYATNWVKNMINQELSGIPEKNWPTALSDMSPNFDNAPMRLQSFQYFDKVSQARLLKWGLLINEKNNYAATISFISPDPKQVVVLGPKKDPRPLLIYAWVSVGLLLLFLIVWLWTYPFYRNLNKLQSMADAYGRGQFDYEIKVPRQLALFPLYKNLSRMGQHIKKLIASHKELTNAVSHEIRSPLARIRFATEMLSKEGVNSQYLQRINHDVEELDQMVDELLTYARFDRTDPALQFADLPIAPFVRELFALLQSHHPERQWQLQFEMDDSTLLRFDAYFMKRALENVLSNACRYAQHQVTLTVKVQSGHCLFVIDDDGQGIPLESRQDLFEPFKRLDTSRNKETGGHGLGLAISKKIIEAQGGQIQVEDSPLGGARFTLSIPLRSA
ncbi:MAG: ATP-binding protein [Gammaproteobacteria bacterium]|nr:ATP-binding protein [Gammaproteobacteria bacterium]